MARQFIFKDTETGRELVLPVTPGSYDVEHGRKAAGITMQEAGDVNLPGPAVLLDTELTCLLPAQGYPFNQPGGPGTPSAPVPPGAAVQESCRRAHSPGRRHSGHGHPQAVSPTTR